MTLALAQGQPDSTSPPSRRRYPLVLVEDDASVRALLERLLKGRGYDVHAHDRAETALEHLKAMTSPILVTDKQMPGMTGLELIERVRAERSDFEAILITAYADVESLAHSLRLGVFRCVLKPFHNEDVLAAVEGAANRLWLRLDLRARTQELEARNEELERMVAQLHGVEQQRVLQERLASIGRLAAGVAHEINTPLAAVIANLTVLAEELSQMGVAPDQQHLDQAQEALADARQAAERVRIIVRDLKAFTRSDAENVGPVDIRRVVEATVNMVWNEIRHRARLVKDFHPAPSVRANDARLGQIVLNLLLNAAQAIPEGNAGNNEIRIVTGTDGGKVLLEVRDTGAGIPQEIIGRVFEPFFTTKPMGVGTGLGLSITHGIVTSLGGSIAVESQPGTGTTFRVLLPVAPAEDAPSQTAPSPPRPAVRPRVLAIDDDEGILTTLTRVLRNDCDLVTVASARDAFGRIQAETFDVILCDLMMPQMTGMELHTVLKAAAPAEADKMIFLTGGTFTPQAQTFLDTVPNLRLEKPFDVKHLRAIIRDRARRVSDPP